MGTKVNIADVPVTNYGKTVYILNLHTVITWTSQYRNTLFKKCTYPLRESTAMSVINSSDAKSCTALSEIFEMGAVINLLESYTVRGMKLQLLTHVQILAN